ncbi:class F sortase [Paenisporosarcina macmurdoensis]|uniref:Class F sortase n=1 Tax=Paenisporosarcina macmurdoensis TaxID=212659 RepID=A0ABW1LBF1_9BACL
MKKLLSGFLGLSLLLTACQAEEATPAPEPTVDKQEASSEEASSSTKKTNLTLSESKLAATKLIKDERQGIVPTRLQIPAINVDAPIDPAGLTEDGDMDVPADIVSTGWFERGYMPGEPGNSVIAGHVDGKNGPAVFYDIGKLKSGDEVLVTGEDGKELVFVVNKVEIYPFEASPLREIFGFSNGSKLNLITCTGEYNKKGSYYEDRLVVYTTLKTS